MKREKTKYPGITYREQERLDGAGLERVYYIRYRRGGRGTKEIEEPVGRESEGMTAAKANKIRAMRAAGIEHSNNERRQEVEAERLKSGEPLTLAHLWKIFAEFDRDKVIFKTDVSFFQHLAPLHKRLIETIENKDVDDLTRRLLSTPRRGRKDGGCLSPKTVGHVLALLKRMLHFAERRGLSSYPTGLRIILPKVDNEKTESMTLEQRTRYLQALDEEPDQDAAAILRLALLTGMRKGALLGLQWTDIDFEGGHITLRGETAKKGKTEFIPLTAAARGVLERIARTESPYVFPGRDGGKRTDFCRMARRVRDKAGLPKDFRPLHGLRHSYASYLASSGKVDLYALQKLLTHESPQMTQRYAHLADEAMKRAASVADGMIDIIKR